MLSMSYYQRHIFFCCNQRENGARCCNDSGAQEIRDYAKTRVKELKLSGPGKTRVNSAGCLDLSTERYFVCEALAGKNVWCQRFGSRLLVTYRHMHVREIDRVTGRTTSVVQPATRGDGV